MARVRQGGGFGIVVLLVVLVVIMLLASRAMKSVMPTALDIAAPGKAAKRPSGSADLPPASVNSGAGQKQIQSSLAEAKKKTDAHSGQLEKALGE
jgi:predicted lipid-binding transport protein (Tim44 family)